MNEWTYRGAIAELLIVRSGCGTWLINLIRNYDYGEQTQFHLPTPFAGFHKSLPYRMWWGTQTVSVNIDLLFRYASGVPALVLEPRTAPIRVSSQKRLGMGKKASDQVTGNTALTSGNCQVAS